MQLKPIGHNCPVCTIPVLGYRNTRIYCSDSCKAVHHIKAKKQLKDRISDEITKGRIKKCLSLSVRNLYLCEGLVGPNFTKAIIDLRILKTKKFQFAEIFNDQNSIKEKKYVLSNFNYWVEGKNLHIERIGETNAYEEGYYERWLIDYPEKQCYGGFEGENEVELKNRILSLGGAWRE